MLNKLTNSETVFTRNCTLIFPHPLIELCIEGPISNACNFEELYIYYDV